MYQFGIYQYRWYDLVGMIDVAIYEQIRQALSYPIGECSEPPSHPTVHGLADKKPA